MPSISAEVVLILTYQVNGTLR